MDVYEQLKSRLTFLDDPNWGKRDKAEKALICVHDLSGAVLTTYQALRGDLGKQAELSIAIQRVHDEFIAPIDLPGVGPFLEPVIDRNLGVILGGIVRPIDAALDKVIPNPAV